MFALTLFLSFQVFIAGESVSNPKALNGDWNGNGIAFDDTDLAFFKYVFCGPVNADFNADGTVDNNDLADWRVELNGVVPSNGVVPPESP